MQEKNAWVGVAKIALPALLAAGIGYYLYSSHSAAAPQTPQKKEEVKPALPQDAKTKLNLASASREDVIGLLAEVIQVQKQLGQLMDQVIQRLVEKSYTMTEIYRMVADDEPRDPLEAHGLTIQSFDALLDRFANDEEVHRMIVRVIQGPESTQSAASGGASVVAPHRIVEINAAMRDRLAVAANELKSQQSSLGAPYKSRTASLAAQAVVGAYVMKEFGVSSEDMERSMIIHQYELSQSSDFTKINDEIQEIMQRFLTESESD